MKCIVLIFVLFGFCKSEEGDDVKQVQTRGAFQSRYEEQERDVIYPNDFSINRDSTKPNANQFHSHHRHGPYHSYHSYHSGYPEPHYHHHHEFNNNSPLDDRETDGIDYYALNSSGIPLDFAKSINDYIVSDLLINVIEDTPEEKPLLLSNRFGEVEGNETERNAAQIARPAKCIPELTTVRIAQSNDPNIFYVPECTRVERCGGCCSHVLLACQPVETETVTFTVMKTEYTGNKKLKYVGKEPVLVEKHTKCKCGCKIKKEDCNTYQEYRESECRCICKNTDEEKKCYKNSFKKLWNPDVCACQCREVSPCSTGFQFDYNECRCVQSQLKRRYILTETHKEQQPETPLEDNKE